MSELYYTLKDKLTDNDWECEFDIKQIIFYEKANPSKKIALQTQIESLTDKHICIIFPKDNRPIIECQLGDSQYFIYDYTRNDRLEMVIKKLKGSLNNPIQL